MGESIQETELARTERMASTSRPTASAPRRAASASGATSKRSLPPGALRSDRVDVTGAPRRRWRRRIAAGATILGAAALVLIARPFLAPPPAALESVAVLEIVHGTIEMLPAEGRIESRLLPLAGTEIPIGTVIETGASVADPTSGSLAAAGAGGAAAAVDTDSRDDSGRAALRLESGVSLRLDVATRVRMASASALVLERGAVYVDTAGAAETGDDASVEVRTTLGVVRDVGTQFEVRLFAGAGGEPLQIRVREGRVEWSRDGATRDAAAGEELLVDAAGRVASGAVPIHGPHWDWVLETAPLPVIDGRPLRAFLDWYAREGGWTLRFADPATADLATSTVLHGAADGLTATEAAAMALRGSGLVSRSEEGVLWVEPAAP